MANPAASSATTDVKAKPSAGKSANPARGKALNAPVTLRKPLSYQLMLWLFVTLLLGWITMIVVMMLQKEDYRVEAYEDGRLIYIDITTGKIDGVVSVSGEEASRQERIARHLTKMGEADTSQAKLPAAIVPDKPKTAQPDAVIDVPAVAAPAFVPSSREVKTPLANAPIAEMQETLPNGFTLPRISDDGELQPWFYYSKPYDYPQNTQLLSIVITDVGRDTTLTNAILAMDEYLTLAFSPYAAMLEAQIDAARASGFESWLMLPLQHETYPINDNGPLTLLEEETPQENMAQLQRLMAKAYGYVGLVSTHNERFSRSPQMQLVETELSNRGIALLSYNEKNAKAQRNDLVIYGRNHIDGGSMPAQLEDYFREVEAYIHKNGATVITLDPLPNLLDYLNEWILTLPGKNIQLVPLSAHAKEGMLGR